MLVDKKHMMQRGFLIGGGPSINDVIADGFDFKSLQEEVTIGVNKAYKLLLPTYLFYQDDYIWDEFKEEISELPSTVTILCPYYAHGGGNDRVTPINTVMSIANLPESFKMPVGTKNNAGVTALRIAYILGLNPIYLVGIDLNEKDAHPDKFNFHTDYDAKRQAMVSPEKIALFRKYFLETITEMQRKNVTVFSCSKTSSLNAFIPFVDIKNLI